MQAIHTKFIAPTNHRGSRVSAQCAAGRIVVSWDYSADPDGNHARAARMLVQKLGWATRDGGRTVETFVSGSLADGSYVHTFVTKPWTADATV